MSFQASQENIKAIRIIFMWEHSNIFWPFCVASGPHCFLIFLNRHGIIMHHILCALRSVQCIYIHFFPSTCFADELRLVGIPLLYTQHHKYYSICASTGLLNKAEIISDWWKWKKGTHGAKNWSTAIVVSLFCCCKDHCLISNNLSQAPLKQTERVNYYYIHNEDRILGPLSAIPT